MALILNYTVSSLNTSGKKINTADSTGAYNVSTNPGGYGTPNPARVDINLFAYSLYKTTSEDIPVTSTPNNTDTHVVSTWEVDCENDGYYKLYLFGVKNLGDEQDPSDAHTIGEFMYSKAQDELFVVEAYEEGEWVFTPVAEGEAVIPYLYDNISEVTYVDSVDYLVLIDTLKCKTLANYDFLSKNCSCQDPAKNSETQKALQKYEEIKAFIEGALDNAAADRYTISQELVEHLTQLCECYQD